MKKFSSIRGLDDIINNAENKDWKIDITNFLNGSNNINLINEKKKINVYVNLVNGIFTGTKQEDNETVINFSHLTEELDNEEWYIEILNILYC